MSQCDPVPNSDHDGHAVKEDTVLPDQEIDKSPLHDLGDLRVLPVELLRLIMLEADLESVENFRLVNRLAHTTLKSIREYRVVREHAWKFIREASAINALHFTKLQCLYEALFEDRCIACIYHTEFLHLLTCKRVCVDCLQDHLIHRLKERQILGVTSEMIYHLPATRPNIKILRHYSWDNSMRMKDIYEAGVEIFGCESAIQDHLAVCLTEQELDRNHCSPAVFHRRQLQILAHIVTFRLSADVCLTKIRGHRASLDGLCDIYTIERPCNVPFPVHRRINTPCSWFRSRATWVPMIRNSTG